MTTLNDLVTRVQRRVLSSMREETDTLGANIGTTDTTISLTTGSSLGSISQNTILQIDYELMLVTSPPSSASSIPVQRGYSDTATTSHTSSALITVNPRFPAADIVTAINDDIADLSSPPNGLFQPQEMTLIYNPVIFGYDFTDSTTGLPVDPTTVIDLLEVRAHEYGPFQIWPVIPLSKVRLQRQADTTVFPSGMAIHIMGGQRFPGRPIRVQYKASYSTPLVNATDDVFAVTGLQPQAHDIPPLGATIQLMQYREIPRSFSEAQPQPRRAQEVPVGASLTALKGVMQQRMDRIGAERARLNAQFRQQIL